jgi:hypothetical protein
MRNTGQVLKDIQEAIKKEIKKIDDDPRDGKFYLPVQLSERAGLVEALSIVQQEETMLGLENMFDFLR